MDDLTFVPLIGFVALGFVMFFRATAVRDHLPAGALCSYGWAPAFLVYLCAAAEFCRSGLYVGSPVALIVFAVVVTACGAASMWRWDLARLLAQRTKVRWLVRGVRDAIILALAAYLTFIAMELCWNENLLTIDWVGQALALGVIALGALALYFAGQRRGGLVAVGSVALTLAGVAQYFVVTFKGTPITPADVTAIGTAAEVAGGFDYELGDAAFLAFGVQAVATFLLSLILPLYPGEDKGLQEPWSRIPRWYGYIPRTCVNVLLTVAFAAGVQQLAVGQKYEEAYGLVRDYWIPINTYHAEGFLTAFLMNLQDLPIDVPEGYSEEAADRAARELAALYDEHNATTPDGEARAAAETQFDELHPTVICVMDETFADLSRYNGLGVDYEGPENFRAVDDALVRGELDVSVRGGGTCNTEFEMLTGVSMGYVGPNKYPYQFYDLDGIGSLAGEFRRLGYATTAMHPNEGSNWQRDIVYPEFGFDDTLFIEDFEGNPYFHTGVSDAATFDKILGLLEADDGPQFIFDVTMQNHIPYTMGNIPPELACDYGPAGFSDEQNAELNEYLSCIWESDRALGDFMEQLRRLDRPVVLVFFGDHQPGFSPDYNDAFFPGEDELVHEARTYKTDYLIWANYDVAGNDQASATQETSPSYLGAMVKNMIGAPLTDYDKARLGARLAVPSVNLMGYEASDGSWCEPEPGSPDYDTWRDLALVAYERFGSRV